MLTPLKKYLEMINIKKKKHSYERKRNKAEKYTNLKSFSFTNLPFCKKSLRRVHIHEEVYNNLPLPL